MSGSGGRSSTPGDGAAERIADALFEQAAVGIAQVALDGRWLRVNQRLCEIVGYSQAEMVNLAFQDITYPGDLPTDQELVTQLLGGQRNTYSTEKRYVRKDGSLVWVNLTVSLVRDRSGEPDYFISVVEDIQRRKEAETDREQLLSEIGMRAMEMETIIFSIADGVVVYGPGGEILRMNATAQHMLKYSEAVATRPIEQRLKTLHLETVGGRPFPEDELPFVRALRGETVTGAVMKFSYEDTGEPDRWVSASTAPILGLTGKISGAVATFTDITEIHKLHEWQQDLVRAVSHDLRTPLTAIIGNAQLLLRMLQRTGAEERYISNVGAIVKGASRMDRMILDLVESARLESGQLTLEKHEIDVVGFISDLLRRNEKSLDVERVRVDSRDLGEPVCVDPHHLERILINLITNALKYSDPDTEVEISVRDVDSNLKIAVTDRGEGIIPEDLPHLFDRFYRAKGTRKAEGLGLGLYITRMLVEAQGGSISIDSKPGVGSTFSFTLPLADGRDCSA